jgi:hypothetical protein
MTIQLIHGNQFTLKIPYRQKREYCAQNWVELHPAARPHSVSLVLFNLQSYCAWQKFQVTNLTAPYIKKGLVTPFAQTLAQNVTTGNEPVSLRSLYFGFITSLSR